MDARRELSVLATALRLAHALHPPEKQVFVRAPDVVQWKSIGLASKRSWVQSPAPLHRYVAFHPVYSSWTCHGSYSI